MRPPGEEAGKLLSLPGSGQGDPDMEDRRMQTSRMENPDVEGSETKLLRIGEHRCCGWGDPDFGCWHLSY